MSISPLISSHLPSYTKNYFGNTVTIYWYEEEFSQSRYPPGQKSNTAFPLYIYFNGSNNCYSTNVEAVSEACTLICLLVAQRVSQTGLLLYSVEKSPEITIILAEALIEGNAIHAWIVKRGLVSHPYLSTEEALKLGGRSLNLLTEWTFQVFYERIEKGLYQHVSRFLSKWYAAPKSKNLFMLLITCGRTVLFIFQERTYMVTFFDSHSHNTLTNANRGLVIAQTTMDKLELLCNWYIEDILNKCYNTKATEYELAFLYPHNSACCSCNPICNCTNHCRNHDNSETQIA